MEGYDLEGIKSQLREGLEGFIPVDNISRDYNNENQVILNSLANIWVKSAILSGKILSVMNPDYAVREKNYQKEEKLYFKLQDPICVSTPKENGIDVENYIFSRFFINPGSKNNTERFGVDTVLDEGSLISPHRFKKQLTIGIYEATDDPLEEANRIFERDIFEYILPSMYCNTRAKFFHFVGIQGQPYGYKKLPPGRSQQAVYQWAVAEENAFIDGDFHEREQVNKLLQNFISGNREISFNSSLEKKYNDWLQYCIPFRDRSKEIRQILLKTFDEKTMKKSLVPVTLVPKRGEFGSNFHTIPLLKQSLFNLEKFSSGNHMATIVTDSPEIASINDGLIEGVRWVSFVCDYGRYKQVDWSPLVDSSEPVFLLITNHSGDCLAKSYVNNNNLIEYLNFDLRIDLNIIQMSVDYESQNFRDLSSLVNSRSANTDPVVNTESIMILSTDEYKNNLTKAYDELTNKPTFWQISSDGESVDDEEVGRNMSRKLDAIPYLYHPIISSKDITLLHGNSESGKSSFIMSLCASLVSAKKESEGNRIFENKTWSPSRDNHKVVYFHGESDEKQFNEKMKTFCYGYLPGEAKLRDGCLENIIFEDISCDFSNSSNHENIIDTIKGHKDSGTKGRPATLVVVDTYQKAVRSEDKYSWSKIESLAKEIKRETGATVLIIHHSNNKGDAKGNSVKVDGACNVIKYSRNEKGSLSSSAATIELTKLRYYSGKVLREPFNIVFDSDEKRWNEAEPTSSFNTHFEKVNAEYTSGNFHGDSIAKMLGMGTSKYKRLRPPKTPKTPKKDD
jgi:hypothetical protein